MKHLSSLLVIILGLNLVSCVSGKKYLSLRSQLYDTQVSRDSLLNIMNNQREPSLEIARKDKQLAELEDKYAGQSEDFRGLKNSYDDLLRQYDELVFQQKSAMEATSVSQYELSSSVSGLQEQIKLKDRQIKGLERTIQECEAALSSEYTANEEPAPQAYDSGVEDQLTAKNADLAQQLIDCEDKLGQLYTALDEQERALKAMRIRINEALLGFTTDELSVSESNGKLYVTLSQNLLFKSGSAYVDKKGREAIKKLANALKRNDGFLITVEGHTDTDGSAEKNWDLSLQRAKNVAKLLIGAGVDAKRVSPAGRSYHLPVASNKTKTGKAKNRRTEIILTPNLGQLYQVVNP